MSGHAEQYIWLTFGKSDIAETYTATRDNGGALIGLGYKYTENGFVTNDFFAVSGMDYPWGEFYPMDANAVNHALFSISAGFYRYYLNGNLIFENPLPTNYAGGYLGLGTAYSGTVISNITVCGKKAEIEKCGYLKNVIASKAGLFSPEVFYSKDVNGFKRTFNCSGGWDSNAAILFFDGKYTEFVLEYDFKFANCFSSEVKEEKTVKDPFEQYIIGPTPQKHWVDWCKTTGGAKAVKHSDCLEIKTGLLGFDRSFYISAPDIGGIRISSEKSKTRAEAPEEQTGIFEPESSLALSFDTDNTVIGADGTRACFVSDGEFWHIDIRNASDKLLYTLNQWNFSFADDRGCVKQYRVELQLEENESAVGCGERFGGFEQHGRRVAFWNTDPCYHWSQSSDGYDLWRAYKNVPLVHTGRGCSLFFNTTCNGYADFAATEESRMLFEFDDWRLDFYVWAGSIKENLVKYTDLTGKQLLPPEWAFHYMAGGSNGFWKCGGGPPADRNAYMELLKNMIAGYKKIGTKPSALYCEGLVGRDFEAYKLAEEYGSRILCWQCADAPVDLRRKICPEAPDSELPVAKRVSNPNGQPFYFIDFPADGRLEFMQAIYGENIKSGLAGGMVDFAELVPIDALFANGLTGDRMHNFFSYWYARAYYELYSSIRNDDFLCYIRGGCAGSQKWLCTWCGDQYASFDGLKQQLAAGLSISASGFSIWGGDLAGLCGLPTPEVFIRGTQFSTFQPLMRAGGDSSKQPWDYGEKAVEVHKTHYWLRENLAPMIYSYAVRSHKTGLPITMTLETAYGCGKCSEYNETQYMFGDDILFAPVLEENPEYKRMLFPSGKWYGLFTEETVDGDKEYDIPVCIDYSPTYIKSGAVIPVRADSKMRLMCEIGEGSTEVLIITPPDVKTEHIHYFGEEASVGFVSERKENAFEITAAGEHEFCNAIIFETLSDIEVNGEKSICRSSVEEVLKYGGFAVLNGKTYLHSSETFKSIKVR